jgi:hypothetical protein
MGSVDNAVPREPWNKGKIVGQKAPFKLKDIWALRVRLPPHLAGDVAPCVHRIEEAYSARADNPPCGWALDLVSYATHRGSSRKRRSAPSNQ